MTGQNICHILLVQSVIGVYDGSTGFLGYVACKLITKEFALAVDYIRLPLDQLPDETMAIRDGHTHIGINLFQGYGFDIIDIILFMTFQPFRNGKDSNLMAFLFQFLHQISYRSYHTVHVCRIHVCCN